MASASALSPAGEWEDYYAVLGLSGEKGAPSREEASRAFRRLALRFHPDKLRSQRLAPAALTAAEERFAAITRANEALQDAARAAAFESAYAARRAAAERRQALDERSRALQRDLEAREAAALRARKKSSDASAPSLLQQVQDKDRAAKVRLWSLVNGGAAPELDRERRRRHELQRQVAPLTVEEAFYRAVWARETEILQAILHDPAVAQAGPSP
jgi:curved DNA-binding protein CbpA